MEINLFTYKKRNGFLYKTPSWLKIISMVAATIMFFYFGTKEFIVILSITILLSLFHGFSFAELAKDFSYILLYGIFLYLAAILDNINQTTFPTENPFFMFIPSKQIVEITCRLSATFFLASLLFKTTSPLQLKQGFSQIEMFLRKMIAFIPKVGKKIKPYPKTTESLANVIAFIPQVFQIWNKLDLAWKARGGKNGFKKICKIMPALFSVSMGKAVETSKAMENRRFRSYEDE